MFCTNCGKVCADNEVFCTSCGTPLQAIPRTPVQATSQPMTQAVAQTKVEENSKIKQYFWIITLGVMMLSSILIYLLSPLLGEELIFISILLYLSCMTLGIIGLLFGLKQKNEASKLMSIFAFIGSMGIALDFLNTLLSWL